MRPPTTPSLPRQAATGALIAACGIIAAAGAVAAGNVIASWPPSIMFGVLVAGALIGIVAGPDGDPDTSDMVVDYDELTDTADGIAWPDHDPFTYDPFAETE
jgi:hypothetical protein